MKRTKHGLFIFRPKKTLIWRRHCSIDQSCCSMTSKRFLESSSGMKFFQPSVLLTNQRCVCNRSINQSNRFISARLLFLFCSRVFISRSYETCSNDQKIVFMWKTSHFPSFSKRSLKVNSVMGYFFINPLLCNREVAPGHNMVCVFFSFHFCLPVVPCGLLRCYSEHNRPPGLCFKTRVGAQPLIWKSFFILMQIKLIFTRKVVHLASFWKWGFLELGSGLSFCQWTLAISLYVGIWCCSRESFCTETSIL